MGKWIKATDKVPETGQQVLVFACGGIDVAEFYGFYYNGDQNWSYTGLGSDPEYWMPLPEPPEV